MYVWMIKNYLKYFIRCIWQKTVPYISMGNIVFTLVVIAILYCLFRYRYKIRGINRTVFWRDSLFKSIWIGYIVFIYGVLVIYRDVMPNRKYLLAPFKSYVLLFYGDISSGTEIMLNILMFVPIAAGVVVFFRQSSSDYNMFILCVLIGFMISFGIECAQYIFKKGFFEIDDIINNLLGCICTYAFYSQNIKRHFLSQYEFTIDQ